ncbi:MAG: hypothetical protein KDJ46_08940 [Rhodobiaceae bacterium]|nr:hypothetical protein [Rhodobiaceae bacterium]
MKDTLKQGVKTTRRFTVDENRVITFLAGSQGGGDDGRVYGTPYVIRDIEQTCRDMLLEHLDEGEDSLGTHVDIAHMAPTLLGMWAEVTVEIAKLDGRAVSFNVSVADPVDAVVAKGRHDRFIIDVAKVKERLAAKAAKAKAAQ